jgi:hypothetical protein
MINTDGTPTVAMKASDTEAPYTVGRWIDELRQGTINAGADTRIILDEDKAVDDVLATVLVLFLNSRKP